MLSKKLLVSYGAIACLSLYMLNSNTSNIDKNTSYVKKEETVVNNIQNVDLPEIYVKPMQLNSLYLQEKLDTSEKSTEEEELLKQAGQDSPDAMKSLGDLYLKLAGKQQNQKESYEFRSKSAFWYKSAFQLYKDRMRRGDISSTREVGIMYKDGYGTASNEHRARKYLHKSAEQGDIIAMYHLGLSYYTSKKSPNKVGAQLWLQKAAEKGNAPSMKILGDMYTESYERAKIGKENAITWYKKAIEHGETNALVSLGFFYEYHDNNYEQAFEFYTQAVAMNHFQAHYHLGEMYKNGLGRDVNEEKMVIHYMKGADGYNKDCMKALADCYAYGLGVEKNYTKAMKWYSQAIKRGSQTAEEQLLDFIYETDVEFE